MPDHPNDPAARSKEHAEQLERINQAFSTAIPHNRALGLHLTDFAPGIAWMKLPYNPELVGNPVTRVLHGGAISTLLDSTCGTAVFLAMRTRSPIATLDLRIDYLKPATPDLDVLCKAECFKVTHHVAFVRALAFHSDESDPIAAATGSFMIFQKLPKRGEDKVQS